MSFKNKQPRENFEFKYNIAIVFGTVSTWYHRCEHRFDRISLRGVSKHFRKV